MAAAGTSVTAASVDERLPHGFFVKRGDIQRAFDLSRKQIAGLIAARVFVAKYPVAGGRARFVRSAVVAVARKWEAEA